MNWNCTNADEVRAALSRQKLIEGKAKLKPTATLINAIKGLKKEITAVTFLRPFLAPSHRASNGRKGPQAVSDGSKEVIEDILTSLGILDSRWSEADGAENGGRAEDGEGVVQRAFSQLGITAVYIDNNDRNKAKHSIIDKAAGRIVLLAQTGASYLITNNPHTNRIQEFLGRSKENSFHAVLLDPFSDAALKVYLNWLRAPTAEPPLLRQKHKLYDALVGYRRLAELHEQTPDKIVLKMTHFDLGWTVLSTDKGCFVEPYFQFDPWLRQRQRLDSFEFYLQGDDSSGVLPSRFRPTSMSDRGNSHVDFYLEHSSRYQTWCGDVERLARSAQQRLSLMSNTGQITDGERKEISSYLSSLQSELPLHPKPTTQPRRRATGGD